MSLIYFYQVTGSCMQAFITARHTGQNKAAEGVNYKMKGFEMLW